MAVHGTEKHRILTHQQMRFVQEYILDPTNATKAAIRAGYSKDTANVQSSRLLADPRVRRLVNKANEQSIEDLGVTKLRVLQELAKIAFSNIKDIIIQDSEGNTTVDLKNLKAADAAGIAEVTITTSGGKSKVQVAKIKMVDKNTALEKLGKHLQLFNDKLEVSGKLDLLQLVEASINHRLPTNVPQPEPLEIEFIEPTVEFIENQLSDIMELSRDLPIEVPEEELIYVEDIIE